MHSGRRPSGSRTAKTASRVRITSEYAPSARAMKLVSRASQSGLPGAAPGGGAASIWVITSLSLEEISPTPRSSSVRRSSSALVRLPLWPTPSGPYIVSIR